MVDKSNKKSGKIVKNSAIKKPSGKSFDDGKKSVESKISPGNGEDRREPLPNDVRALITAAENRIKEFFDATTKKVSDFMENDLRQFKEISKDELTKINNSLMDYRRQLEKMSEDNIIRVAEMKNKLQKRIMTVDELQSFVNYLDDKMTDVKRITQNIIVTMRDTKIANNFTTDLQSLVGDYSKRVATAMDGLSKALKKTSEDLRNSVPDKATFVTRITKIPRTLELQKLPSVFGNVFKRMGSSSFGSDESGKSQENPSMRSGLRGKLPTLNLNRHFNSETMYGRANVAKLTYGVVGVLILYFTLKPKSKK